MKSHISNKSFFADCCFSLEELVNERDFANYLRMLRSFAQRYCVMVTACDTPCGPKLTKEIAAVVTEIGFKENLFGKFRCGYAAMIDMGKLVCEKLENDRTKYVDMSVELDNGDRIRLLSSGYDAVIGRRSEIQVNDMRFPYVVRGLIFVIYDKFTRSFLDAALFDPYGNDGVAHLPKYDAAVKSFLASHPGVLPVFYYTPVQIFIPYTQNEQMILNSGLHSEFILENSDKPISALSIYYDKEGLEEVLAAPDSYIDYNGVKRMVDKVGKYVNIVDRHRVTEFQPINPDNCIYMIGECRIFGYGSDDKQTIESILQKELNEHSINFKVINYGSCMEGLGFGNGEYFTVMNSLLNSLPLKAGDIFLIENHLGYNLKNDVSIDLMDIFSNPHNEDFYFDRTHYTPAGNRVIAQKLFEALAEQGVFDKAAEARSFTPPA